MDWICGFLAGGVAGCIFGLTLSRPDQATTEVKAEWNPEQHPLRSEGEALKPFGGTE